MWPRRAGGERRGRDGARQPFRRRSGAPGGGGCGEERTGGPGQRRGGRAHHVHHPGSRRIRLRTHVGRRRLRRAPDARVRRGRRAGHRLRGRERQAGGGGQQRRDVHSGVEPAPARQLHRRGGAAGGWRRVRVGGRRASARVCRARAVGLRRSLAGALRALRAARGCAWLAPLRRGWHRRLPRGARGRVAPPLGPLGRGALVVPEGPGRHGAEHDARRPPDPGHVSARRGWPAACGLH
mmetsp:Transcript_15658/g.53454  ORF Transcript_15658/g.53454 Transcript_15658/m.53454 type:complete len:238 (-) Transcript_15658:1340-2053(-)